MSIVTAKQFLQRVQKNNGKREETLAEVVRIGAADGFVFTAGEYESALSEHLTQHARPIARELSEEELELVAGGTKRKELQQEIKERQARIC